MRRASAGVKGSSPKVARCRAVVNSCGVKRSAQMQSRLSQALLLRRATTEEETHMPDRPYPDTDPDTGDDTGLGSDCGSPTSPPRGMSVLGIVITIVLLLLIVVLHLTGILGPGLH
jgi:hypothetical protein